MVPDYAGNECGRGVMSAMGVAATVYFVDSSAAGWVGFALELATQSPRPSGSISSKNDTSEATQRWPCRRQKCRFRRRRVSRRCERGSWGEAASARDGGRGSTTKIGQLSKFVDKLRSQTKIKLEGYVFRAEKHYSGWIIGFGSY